MVSIVIVIVFALLIRFIIKGSKDNPLLVLTGIGLFIPYAINILYTFGMIPFPHDLTPIGFFFTFILFVVFAYRSQLFNVKTTLFSTTMDAIEDIIIICNEDNIIIDANHHAYDMFHSFPIIIGRTKTDALFDFMNNYAEAKPNDLINSAKSGLDVNGEYTIFVPDGGKQTYTLNWRAVFEGSKKTGFVLMMADVTRYRMMINEINQKNDEL